MRVVSDEAILVNAIVESWLMVLKRSEVEVELSSDGKLYGGRFKRAVKHV